MPGGVNSPARAFGAVGGEPIVFARGSGAYLWDADGNRYIDYIGSWGPHILGHAHPRVVEAVERANRNGTSFGAPTEAENTLCELIVEAVPSIERVRLVNSGTEATMSAIRLARGYTGRDVIVKFAGNYHGHVDSLLVAAGSSAATLAVPNSPGVTAGASKDTLILQYNDVSSLDAAFAERGSQIAGIIVEPIVGNMGTVVPTPEFLAALRTVTRQHNAVLIFDEVMTGFRVARGGAQGLFGITPDLTTLGKVIGGGMPVAAFGGRADIMDRITPDGPVFHAGTLSGNPIGMAAGIATLKLVTGHGFFEALTARTAQLARGFQERARAEGVPLLAQGVGGMFGIFFTEESSITRFAQVMACDVERFKRFFHAMLDGGIYLAPSAYEAGFVSAAHTDADIRETLDRATAAFGRI
jgi:glutamate-1-semialdehyde 2,1-aminomutase